MGKRINVEEIINLLKIKNPNIEVSNVFTSKNEKNGRSTTFCECKCTIDNHKWTPRLHHLKSGTKCPVCSGKVVSNQNSIRTLRPDLIKYLKNESDADKYTCNTTKRIDVICPDCGFGREPMLVSNLSKNGFACKFCSDGISLPEKFCINLLNILQVDFTTRKRFEWSQNKIYDFYIPSLNMIIEIHGSQHYIQSRWRDNKTLEQEKLNDKIKYDMAIKNCKCKYIVIDCRKSELDWLKDNHKLQLENIFNLDTIDWMHIWEKSQKSIKAMVWNDWENKTEKEDIISIANKFNLTRDTISIYLKIGDALGKCKYDTEVEKDNGRVKGGVNRAKEVFQYDKNGLFINQWRCASEAQKYTGICSTSISKCCGNKQKTAGTFVWKYKYGYIQTEENNYECA